MKIKFINVATGIERQGFIPSLPSVGERMGVYADSKFLFPSILTSTVQDVIPEVKAKGIRGAIKTKNSLYAYEILEAI